MILSEHFTLAEFERSDVATRKRIPNKMNAAQTVKAVELCTAVLEVIREYYGKPVVILSGFRSEAVNAAVGGSSTSQHKKGEAADFYVSGVPVEQVFEDIHKGRIPVKFDQLIEEGTWIHISYRKNANQMEALRAEFTEHGVKYHPA